MPTGKAVLNTASERSVLTLQEGHPGCRALAGQRACLSSHLFPRSPLPWHRWCPELPHHVSQLEDTALPSLFRPHFLRHSPPPPLPSIWLYHFSVLRKDLLLLAGAQHLADGGLEHLERLRSTFPSVCLFLPQAGNRTQCSTTEPQP